MEQPPPTQGTDSQGDLRGKHTPLCPKAKRISARRALGASLGGSPSSATHPGLGPAWPGPFLTQRRWGPRPPVQPKPRLNSSRALQHFMPRLMPTAHCASPTGPAAAGISRLGGEQSGLVCPPCCPARGHRTWGRAVERTTCPGIYVTHQAAGLWTLAVCSLAREEEKSMLSLTASLI